MKCIQCERPVYAKGLCKSHHLIAWRASRRPAAPASCAHCGASISQVQHGRRRRHCSDRCAALAYRAPRRDIVNQWQRAHYARNRDQILAEVRAWRAAHPEYCRAVKNARRLRVRIQTPAWADMAAIVDFYMRCPDGHEVDHIYPLKGKTVSGLHVRENLQYLPMVANRKKGTRVDILQEAA